MRREKMAKYIYIDIDFDEKSLLFDRSIKRACRTDEATISRIPVTLKAKDFDNIQRYKLIKNIIFYSISLQMINKNAKKKSFIKRTYLNTYLNSPSLGRMCIKIKASNQIQFFTPEYMCTCDELDNVCFNYQFKIFTLKISNIERLIKKSFYCILLLLAGSFSLDVGPKSSLQPFDSDEWNTFKLKGLHLIHLNINSLLPKIDELQHIANSSNASVIGISESKLDESILQSEIQISN